MRSMRSFQSSVMGFTYFKKESCDCIGLEERDAPMRALARETGHGFKTVRFQCRNRLLNILDARGDVIEPEPLSHDLAREFRALRVLEQLDGHVFGVELGYAQSDVGQLLHRRLAEENA